jgi:hypothetical protein
VRKQVKGYTVEKGSISLKIEKYFLVGSNKIPSPTTIKDPRSKLKLNLYSFYFD